VGHRSAGLYYPRVVMPAAPDGTESLAAAFDPAAGEFPDRREEFLAALEPIARAIGARIVPPADAHPSDVPLQWGGEVVGALQLPQLHDALDRLIEGVERELGGRLEDLSREDKQQAIRLLDERGAFVLRRSVEDVADAFNVSRITIYNYLNAVKGDRR
jgi:HTH domain